MVKIPSTPISYPKRIFLENLQENGGWHYNLLTYPKLEINHLSESQVEENLKVKLPDGRTFQEIFWPELKVQKRTWSQIVKKPKTTLNVRQMT